MSRYKKFKLQDDYIDAGQVLLHTIYILDLAAEIAHAEQDFDKLLKVGKTMLKTSDGLIALALGTEEEKEETEIVRTNGDFGFTPKAPSDNSGSESEIE